MDAGEIAHLHQPVLLSRCLDLLAPALTAGEDETRWFIDATLGMGGHSEAVLEAFSQVRVIGLDRDPSAIDLAGRRLAGFGERFQAVHAVFDEIGEIADRLAPEGVHGILFDLGISSLQVDEADRGFAYAKDAPLDMRMDPTTGMTAADVLNSYSVEDLATVLREYGDERFARRIALAIVRRREQEPWQRSADLVALIREAIPAATRRTGGHPAKRTFQALRIEVNGELAALERALPAAIDRLQVGGRLVVESYQSTEDRIVKRIMAAGTTDQAPPDLPLPGHEPVLRALTRGAEQADEAELARNPRASSVRLRAVERVRPGTVSVPDRLRAAPRRRTSTRSSSRRPR